MSKGRYIPEPLNMADNFDVPSTSGTKDIPQENESSAKEDVPSTSSVQSETPTVQNEPAKEKPKMKANIHHQPKQMRNKKRERNQRYRKNLSERRQFWQSQNAYFSHQDKNLKYENNPVGKPESHNNRKPRFGSQENTNRKQRFGSENDFNRKQRFGSKNDSNRKQRFGSEVKRDQNSKVSPSNDQKQKGHLESPAKKSSQSKPTPSSSSNSSTSTNSSPFCSKAHSVHSQKSHSSSEQKGKQKVNESTPESKPNALNPNKIKVFTIKRKDETTLIKRTYLVDISLTIPVPMKSSHGPKKLWVPKSA